MESLNAAGLLGWTVDEAGLWTVYLVVDGEIFSFTAFPKPVSWWDPMPENLQYRETAVIR